VYYLLASALLGLVKGLGVAGPVAKEEAQFSFERDLWGPAKEELVYRAAPLWAFPGIPFGTTAVLFAVDHVLDDMHSSPNITAGELAARFGDTLLGGLMYESAYRRQGTVAAIAAHALHNASVGVGARLRGGG
jgi:membrane protease YdiL (CAAX protease family)